MTSINTEFIKEDSFGQRLYKWGIHNYKSIKLFAKELDIPKKLLQDYCDGLCLPTSEMYEKLRSLGCNTAWLIPELKITEEPIYFPIVDDIYCEDIMNIVKSKNFIGWELWHYPFPENCYGLSLGEMEENSHFNKGDLLYLDTALPLVIGKRYIIQNKSGEKEYGFIKELDDESILLSNVLLEESTKLLQLNSIKSAYQIVSVVKKW